MQAENPADEGANCQPENDAGSADNGSMDEAKPVLYDGEYTLTADGSKDFGEIKNIPKLVHGKIRLRKGEHNNETGKGYGEAHIEVLYLQEKKMIIITL